MRTGLLAALAAWSLAGASTAHAGAPAGRGPAPQVFLTKEEALALAFPKCEVTRTTRYLTDEERAKAAELAGFEIPSGVVHPYVAHREGAWVGTAWFDAHEVRAKRELLMFVVGPDRRLRRLEVLAFAEPPEYLPRGSWYAQFVGQELSPELRLGRGIQRITGATLTARATTEAARRILALHAVVFPPPEPEPEPAPSPEERDEG